MRQFFSLSESCSIKYLEKPYIYNRRSDELYEMDGKGFQFLCGLLNGKAFSGDGDAKEFLDYLQSERLIKRIPSRPEPVIFRRTLLPSLRYLELQLTRRCNLRCKHCYLGVPGRSEMPLADAMRVVDEFEEMQGLRLIVSGGEPMLYSRFNEFNKFLRKKRIRRILLTNGMFLRADEIKGLNFDEIQVSIDGLKESHEMLRGRGTFKKAMSGLMEAKRAGLDISVATMVTSYNKAEFPEMESLFKSMGVREWGIDMPCVDGALRDNAGLLPRLEEAAECMKFAFGSGYHGAAKGFACGHHLCTVTPEGRVIKCGFYPDAPFGTVREGLRRAWARSVHISLRELKDCKGCPVLDVCAGGCRYRAESPQGRDRVMCAIYGIKQGEFA